MKQLFALAIIVCTAYLFIPAGALCEEITVHVNANVPAGTMSGWFEPSMFAQWAPVSALNDFIYDAGGTTSGMIRISIGSELGNSTSLQDLIQRLDASAANSRIQIAANAGAQVLLEISKNPAWISSYTNYTEKVCNDWFKYWTYAPASDKWDDWQAAVYEIVTHFNIQMGFHNVTYEFWNEPELTCFWNDTQSNYLTMWKYTVWGAEQADPNVRLGGIAPSTGIYAKMPGSPNPILWDWMQYSSANNLNIDVTTYHIFSVAPYEHRLQISTIAQWLSDNGYPSMPIIASEFNPRDSILSDPSWPSPPSALGRQVDSEMGAAYVLSTFKYMSLAGQTGNACFAALDNFNSTEEYPSGDWGARTHYVQNQIRKAIYHGLSIAGRMKRNLVQTDTFTSKPPNKFFDHFHTMAGVGDHTMTILSWNYVVCPFYEVWYTLVEIGYDSDDWNRWGGTSTMRLYYDGYIPVEDLTSDPQEQIDLEWSKGIYQNQRVLVTANHSITYDVQGFYPEYGVHVTQYLIDATHSNSYYHYVTWGLPDAINNQYLEIVDQQWLNRIDELGPIVMRPYSVSLLTFEADAVGHTTRLVWQPDSKQLFQWNPAPQATAYDIVRGTLSDLHSTQTFEHAAAFSCSQTAQWASDPQNPPPGDGFYYLVRGRNSSGTGSWGTAQRNSQITACN